MAENYQEKQNNELQSFVEKLVNEHYNSLEVLCNNAMKQTLKVGGLENQQVTSQYILLCKNIISETQEHVKMRKEKYVPYILELAEKVNDSHDCKGCTGNCKLNHDMQLLDLITSNKIMQSMLGKLQIASLPLYSDTIYPEEYRLLRNQMALIETGLTQLFFLENNYLIPKIVNAQKSINAVS